LRVVALLALAVGVSACGIPIDTSAHSINASQVYVPEVQSNVPAGGSSATLTLYFYKDNRLVPVKRPGSVYPLIETTAGALLVDLDNGPLVNEGINLVTFLNSEPGLTCTYNPQNHIITVNLDAQFLNSLFGPSLYEAYGQIVLTLMSNKQLAGVVGIQFQSGGSPTYAYLPTETATRSPVDWASYSTLLSPHEP
jgi:hypothetical protein